MSNRRLWKKIVWSCIAAFAALPAPTIGKETVPPYIAAAVADPNRPDADRQRDADRKPEEVIAFAGIKPGDKIADFMPGGGYFTRILCSVVGDAGHVYAISVLSETQHQSCSNVTASTLQNRKRPAPELWSASDDPGEVYEYWSFTSAAELFAAPEPLDAIWIADNYHDLHNKRFGPPDMLAVGRALFDSLKPGGILIVEDHAATPRSGARDTETLHRISSEQVRKEMIAAGFSFVAASTLLNSPKDSHTTRAHDMHDKTDRFVLKFCKP